AAARIAAGCRAAGAAPTTRRCAGTPAGVGGPAAAQGRVERTAHAHASGAAGIAGAGVDRRRDGGGSERATRRSREQQRGGGGADHGAPQGTVWTRWHRTL